MRVPGVRFTVRGMMLAVACVASALGFAAWMFREPVVPVVIAPPPTRANPDHEIFDLVLADLIDNPEFNSTIGPSNTKKTQVVLNQHTIGHVSREFLRIDTWVRDSGIPEDVLDDLAERNPKGTVFSVAAYRPTNPNIAVKVLGEGDFDLGFYGRFPKACGYVVPYLPGYSRDGKSALFRFAIPPLGYHPGWGSYHLKKFGGRWEIIDKQIYYLL